MSSKIGHSGGFMKARLDELFRTCDKNGRGIIGRTELGELCGKFGIKAEDADAIFNDLDHDGDGEIDYEDFTYGFRDFLTPGSRRGSLQIPMLLNHNNSDVNGNHHGEADSGPNMQAYRQQLDDMEKKHKSARNAWTQLTNNAGITPQQNSGQLYEIIEEKTEGSSKEVEVVLSSLMADVQKLHEEYRSLESSFRKEREVHAQQLAALGEELDQQLAKTEAKAKAEAREEAQKQMDAERRKIATDMETQMADLSAQMMTFKKVEEWLSQESERDKRPKNPQLLMEAESENRNLRSALVEAQTKTTLLQTQLTQRRNEYLDLYNELHSEKMAASEYKNQVDLMQNHLSILSQANRVLSDANDCFSMVVPSSNSNSGSAPNSLNIMPSDDASLDMPTTNASFIKSLTTTDRDSGRGTLLEELRAECGGSPYPSGVWSLASSSSPPSLMTGHFETGVTSRNSKSFGEDVEQLSQDPRSNEGNIIQPKRTFKVILAGDAAVGKTTFIERVCQGHFTPNLSSTIGVDFRVKSVELEGQSVALQLWDTAGQERFRSLTKSYFRRADGVILMYDVNNEKTFLSIRHWIQNVDESAMRKVPIVLCGNKSDLRDGRDGCVTSADGLKVASQCGSLFIETSPKTGENIIETLILLAREMSLIEDEELKHSMRLTDFDGEKTPRKSCCGSGKTMTS